jgi:hypothetical protein
LIKKDEFKRIIKGNLLLVSIKITKIKGYYYPFMLIY